MLPVLFEKSVPVKFEKTWKGTIIWSNEWLIPDFEFQEGIEAWSLQSCISCKLQKKLQVNKYL